MARFCNHFFLIVFLFITSSICAQNQVQELARLQKKSEQQLKKNQIDSSLYFERKAFKIAIQINDLPALYGSHATLGLAYKLKGEYPKALYHLFQALHFYEQKNNLSGTITQLGNIGTVYDMQGEFPKALSYYERSLAIALKIGDQKSISNQYTNVANIQSLTGEYNLAELNYRKALFIDSSSNNLQSFAKNRMNLGSLNSELGKLNESLSNYFDALSIFKQLNDPNGEATALLNISASFTELKQKTKAIDYLNQAFVVANKLNDEGFLAQLESIASQIYADFGDEKLAFLHYKKFIDLRDKLYNNENTKKSLEAELNYNFEKKKLKNEFENQKKVAALKSKNQFYQSITVFSIVFGLLFVLTIFFYMRFKNNKKQLDLKQFHSSQLLISQENERHRIAKELHDSVGQNVLFVRNQLVKSNHLELLSAVDETLQEIRSISKDLFPSQLESYGLKAAVESLFEKAQESTSLFISMDLDDFPTTLSKENQINLFRIIQECLSNAIKHSKATAFRLTVELSSNQIVLLIQDNGVGFDTTILAEKAKKSMGMLNLAERMKILKGKFELDSEPAKGTKLRFVFPYNERVA